MASVDFFPKLDRNLDLQQSNAKTGAAPAKAGQAAKKGASSALESKDQVSFADVLERGTEAAEPAVGDKPLAPAKKEAPLRAEAVKARPVEARIDDVDSEKAALKQKAVVDFIDQMQSKFGVSTEEVVSAFSQLDEEALNGKPEDAMSQFLMALQLPKDQMQDAGKLYLKMVNETGDAMLSEKIASEKSVVAFEVLSPKEMKLRKTTESLNQLSDKFFSGPQVKQTIDPLTGQPIAPKFEGAEKTLAAMMGDASQSASVPANVKNTNQNSIEQSSSGGKFSLAGLGMTAVGGGAALAAQAAAQSKSAAPKLGEAAGGTADALTGDVALSAAGANLEQSLSALEAAFGGEASQNFGDQAGNGESAQNFESALSRLQANSAQMAAPSAFAAAAAQAAKGAYQQSAETRGSEKELSSADLSQAPVVGLGQSMAPTEAKMNLAAGGMVVAQPTMTPEQRQDNINEIIRQAQVIVKEGGGEMKMDLRPEGIGQVHLKVMVQDGKVDVQMLTESDSAKKLLESGLSELKSQLAASKLHVETMKVEAGAEAAFKRFEQGAQDQQREQARQFASDFMGQFRDERQSFFGNYMDRGNSSRGYRADTRKRGNVAPVQVDGVVSANSTSNGREANSNRRLNLVA